MTALLDSPQATIVLHGLCYDCGKFHEYRCTPERFPHAMSEWEVKHRGHQIEFRSPKRYIPRGLDDSLYQELNQAPWWLENFSPNADIKLAYASSADFTLSIAALATSATYLSGYESTAVVNTSNLYLDYIIGGEITVGTTPSTLTSIRVYGYGTIKDSTYFDDFTGTDGSCTLTNAEILAMLPILAELPVVATTSNVAYPVTPRSLAAVFGGIVPKSFGLYVAHNTGVNLNATGGNHFLSYTGVYATG
jgi:hypothetical protein